MTESPAAVAAGVASRLGVLDGQPEPLGGGITNRNFRVRAGGKEYVVRVPGPKTDMLGIDRRTEYQAARAAAAVGIAPEVVLYVPEDGCLVTRVVKARTLSPHELSSPGMLERAAAALRAFHSTGPLGASFKVGTVVASYRKLVLAGGGVVPPAAERAARCLAEIEAALQGPEHEPVPCHNDLLAANFMLDRQRLWIVDWEYAGMGDRYFDLGNLAVNNELTESDEERLMHAYFGEPAGAGRLASLRLMRIVSDFREAMWGLAQQCLSDLKFDFGAYAAEHFERLLSASDDPRYPIWLQDAHAGPPVQPQTLLDAATS